MLEQESVIESVELRTAFSLYCVRMETQLVHTYLETLAHVLNSLVTVQINSHTEVIIFFYLLNYYWVVQKLMQNFMFLFNHLSK